MGAPGPVVGLAVLLLLAGCSDTVAVDAPEVFGQDATTCRELIAALPAQVADQPRRTARTGAGFGAAWGDPAIELRCGVGRPQGFDAVAVCQRANGVDWFIPESQQTGQAEDITMTAVGRAEYVEVRIPAEYFPPVNAMVDLGTALRRTVRSVTPCV